MDLSKARAKLRALNRLERRRRELYRRRREAERPEDGGWDPSGSRRAQSARQPPGPSLQQGLLDEIPADSGHFSMDDALLDDLEARAAGSPGDPGSGLLDPEDRDMRKEVLASLSLSKWRSFAKDTVGGLAATAAPTLEHSTTQASGRSDSIAAPSYSALAGTLYHTWSSAAAAGGGAGGAGGRSDLFAPWSDTVHLAGMLVSSWLNAFVVCVPLGWAAFFCEWSPTSVFFLNLIGECHAPGRGRAARGGGLTLGE